MRESFRVRVLIDLLRVGDVPTKLVAGNALGVISSHVDYIRPVALAGAIPLYSELLHGPEPMGKEIAEDVFCILAVAEENATSIAEHLVQILRGSDDEAKAAAAEVLWGLSGYEHSLSVVRNSGAIPVLVEILTSGNLDLREKDESEELRDNAAEALVNFSEDPLLCDRISKALNVPSFQRMQDWLTQIRASDAHLAASLRRMSIEQPAHLGPRSCLTLF
ncbi:hypothetical protein RJ639_037292 [Escallonia herrerae]|uniref:Uncharacterized protein n=1 Tax=Escallonia herrerae TaxID=1293975 RepID=A0AA88WTK8_9ASTE|nr:hypothetical protein RJ639_037292 [Escallonia herrerae]